MVPPKPTPTPPRSATTSIPSGLSLKIHGEANSDDDTEGDEEPDPLEVPNDEISAGQFSQVWKELAEDYRQESHGLFLALTKYEPLLNKDGIIVVFLDNAIQEDMVSERKVELLSKLRKALNNYGLQMETRIKENGFKQKAYLPKEKLEKLIEKNPLIAKLKKELDLDYDY